MLNLPGIFFVVALILAGICVGGMAAGVTGFIKILFVLCIIIAACALVHISVNKTRSE